jgi:uncharacterized C2H2 Zn-finger protein
MPSTSLKHKDDKSPTAPGADEEDHKDEAALKAELVAAAAAVAAEVEPSTPPAAVSATMLTCTLCPLKFPSGLTLAQHMKDVHWNEHLKTLTETKKGVTQLHCKACSKKFNSAAALATHIKKKHGAAAQGGPDKDPTSSTSAAATLPAPPPPPPAAAASVSPRGEGEEEDGEDLHKYGCSLCGMEYPRLKSLAQHMKKSHAVNMLPCNRCGNTFVHMHNWLDHLKTCDA